ncbi:MAG: GyrI-like domain-containing protein [Polaribacter sp.]|nr:GyrI-like domain-containing protein [Polaribacter sp.]
MKRLNEVRVVDLRSISIAHVNHKGDFQGIGKAYSKLSKWARQQGLNNKKINKTLTIYHNDIDVVGIENLEQSASIILDKKCEPTKEVSIKEFKPGKCAIRRYELNSFFEFKDVWLDMKNFVDNHELEFSMAGSFEVYQPKQNNKTVVDICIPIKKSS